MNSSDMNRQDAVDLFRGSGEVRAHARAMDWSTTPLGATPDWSPALRIMARSIFDSPFPICLWSGPRYVLIYNDAYRRILAAKHPASLGQPGSIVWAEIWEELQPQFDGVRVGGEPVYFEDAPFVMARLEGGGTETAWFNYSLSALRDEDGTVAAILNITPETTDRVLLARRLADEQATLAATEALAKVDAQRVQLALAAGAIVGTWFWDIPADRFTSDEPFARAFGLDPSLAKIGIPLADIFATVHPDDRAGLAKAIEVATLSGGPYAHQYRVRRSDGKYYWIEANGRVDHGVDGTPRSFPGVLIDIEGRRQVERDRDHATAALVALNETLERRVTERSNELMKAEEALRQAQKMEAVGQLTGGLAHDFNNLLAAISGSLEFLKRKLKGDESVARFIEISQSATKRAASLTHRLLAFSRQQTLELKLISINKLIMDFEELIRRTIGPQVTLEVVTGIGVWTVHADPVQLESAILNLCINARDAMPDGGRLVIETANRSLDATTAFNNDMPPGQYVSICISDNGVGMPAEVIARAFDPFFTTKPVGVGTGLGLSMVYGFARQSGGVARIYSEVDKGTNVCLYLPRHHGDPATDSDAKPTARTAESSGETVLVVDDEASVRMLMSEQLRDLGYRVLEASDGQRALEILDAHSQIHLLVTDVGLPGGLNGRQVAEAARERIANLPVLFVTGYAENAVLSHGHLLPGMHVITKPFEMMAFGHRVQAMLRS